MAKPAKKQDPERWYRVEREYPGLDYDPAKVNAEKNRGVMPRPEGYYKPYEIGKEDPPEGHVDTTPHGRSIIDRKQVIKPVEVDEDLNVLDGIDRWDVARRHGIDCPIVVVRGLREDQKADYILEVNTARRDLDPRVRMDLARRYIARDEEAFKSGKSTYRSTYNKVAVICGVGLRRIRQLERLHFPERWKAACAGETRATQNGKTFEVKEADPDSQIQGLLGKLGGDTPIDQQEAAIKALRESLDRHGDVLAEKDRKELKAQVDEADRRVREKKAADEARLSSDSTDSDGPLPVGGKGGGETRDVGEQQPVAAILEAVESEPEFGDRDGRPFTMAIALYLEVRLLPRDELTSDEEWAGRVERVAGRCSISVEDVLRLLRRRPSSLDTALQVLDRLFLASGVEPHELRDSLSKHVLSAIFGHAA